MVRCRSGFGLIPAESAVKMTTLSIWLAAIFGTFDMAPQHNCHDLQEIA
jgi:hypothetical protein